MIVFSAILVQFLRTTVSMDKCTNIYCSSKLPEPLKKSSLEMKQEEVVLGTEASQYSKFERSRPRCRRAVDNLRPEGELLVSTELSSNFTARSPSRPVSAREEFRRRRDNLKTEGESMYRPEKREVFTDHKNERPKIFKPKLCNDCHDPKPPVVKNDLPRPTPDRFNNPAIMVTDIKPSLKPEVNVNIIKEQNGVENGSNTRGEVKDNPAVAQNPVDTADEEDDRLVSWPRWSSRAPGNLGEFVRSVFLDLCDNRRVSELQLMYPHQWGVLVSRLSHRPDLRCQLQAMIVLRMSE